MEKQITCPGCKTILTYKLTTPIAIRCNACTSVFFLEKDGDNATFVKKYYVPPVDRSVLKLNAKGNYQNKNFELIGRIRSVNTFAISNEWLMYFQDGSYMWLAENSACYFIVSVQPISLKSVDLKGKKAGKILRIKEQEYTITEISKQQSFEIEGEIPLDCYTDEKLFKYELIASSKNNEFATVVFYERDLIEAYLSTSVELSSLNLKGINEFKDWID